MVALSHPVGNQNVRQALAALHERGLLDRFFTTVYWDNDWPINRLLPRSVRSELNRRCYPQVPKSLVHLTPAREAMRLLATKFGVTNLVAGDDSIFSATRVYQSLDAATAIAIQKQPPRVLYAYEGGALRGFREARKQGTICVYELVTGYWYYDAEMFREEAELRPEYAATIVTLDRAASLFQARDEELSFADYVFVPSRHIKNTLKMSPLSEDKLVVIPYGAPEGSNHPVRAPRPGKLRVLFVGGLTQRKGISYLIDAVKMLGSSVEFTMIGRKIGSSHAIDAAVTANRWIASTPHHAVLDEMSRHDVLVLPSLTEGYGLVILEALSCGVPVVTTQNTGGPEVIRDGIEGFFVPIRSAEAIAEKLEMLAGNRNMLEAMSAAALKRAQECTWQKYRELLASTIEELMQPVKEVVSHG